MNWKLLRRAGIDVPPDGLTIEEKKIAELLGDHTVQSLYSKLPTNRMKFIVAAHFELGYPQDIVADILGLSQPSLVDEIALIQRVFLGYPYKPYKLKKNQVTVEKLLRTLMALRD